MVTEDQLLPYSCQMVWLFYLHLPHLSEFRIAWRVPPDYAGCFLFESNQCKAGSPAGDVVYPSLWVVAAMFLFVWGEALNTAYPQDGVSVVDCQYTIAANADRAAVPETAWMGADGCIRSNFMVISFIFVRELTSAGNKVDGWTRVYNWSYLHLPLSVK